MVTRWLVTCCTIVVVLGCVLTAPLSQKNEHDLSKSITAFLKQDKEFLSAVEKGEDFLNIGDALVRNRRQAEGEFDEAGEDGGPKEPGFFDRAAKFVMELLQRFLKWVNTDNN